MLKISKSSVRTSLFAQLALAALVICGEVPARAEAQAPHATASSPASQAVEPSRVIALQGQHNFRDLGGYRTSDGRSVKWGQIYRSGELSHLTPEDYQRLSALHIHTIFDLRNLREQAAQRTVWQAGEIESLASAKPTTDANMALLSSPNVTSDQVQEMMLSFYRRMPELYAPEYRVIFHQLLEGHAPLLLHCTAGKDRTGLGSALILTALGVPRATVVQDYALTTKLLQAAPPAKDAPGMESLRRLSPALQAQLMSADPAYIEAALDAIQAKYGSFDAYLQQELDISPAQVAMLRGRLLQ